MTTEPQSFVHTSEISVLDFGDVQITIDRNRLQVAAKEPLSDPVTAAQIASRYVKVLEHIPYTAVGLNLSFAVDLDFELAALRDGQRLPLQFGPYALTFGTIMAGAASDHRLRVVAEPTTEGDTLQVSFNFHLDVASAGAAATALARAAEFTDIARGLVGEFFAVPGGQG